MSGTPTPTKPKRLPNPQPNGIIPSLSIEVLLDGQALGAIGVPQDPFLSKSGNVLFYGKVARGWTLPDFPGGAEEALAALGFVVNGHIAKQSEKGVHLTPPQVRDGKEVAGSGGELIVAHTAILDVSTVEADETAYMVNLFAKKVKAKAGKEQHYGLRVQGMPRAIGTPGVQIVGDMSGLLVVTG